MGWEILYNPTAVALHLETATRRKFSGLDDFPSRKKFREDHKDILKKQMNVMELFKIQNPLM
jgi:hypothetical protein